MNPSRLERSATPEALRRLAHAGLIDAPALERALKIAGARPTAASWARFARSRLLLVGAVLTAVGVVFLVAANWEALGPFVRMGLVAAALAAATAAAAVLGLDTLGGRTAALLAGLLFGPLVALYGQTYQTGADSWALFAAWAVVMAAYAVSSRFLGAWILALGLLHMAALLWWDQAWRGDLFSTRALPVAAALALLDGLLVAASELRWVPKRIAAAWTAEPAGRAWPRTVAVLGMGVLTATGLSALVESDGGLFQALALPVALVGVLLLIGVYRRRIPDLFMVVVGVAAACVLASTLLGRVLFDWMMVDEAVAILLLGLAISAQVALVARWLLDLARRGTAS